MGNSVSDGEHVFREQHAYEDCLDAIDDKCGFPEYCKWRRGVDFEQAKHCWKCGLSQRICRRLEQGPDPKNACDYPDIMLPAMFIFHQRGYLAKLVQKLGFRGEYKGEDLVEWLNSPAEGFGLEWQSNWMQAWEVICETYIVTRGEESKRM